MKQPDLSEIPQLEAVQRLLNIPPRLQAALDARAAEKALLSQLVEQWLDALRPEMERMTREIVERSVQDFWRRHATKPPHEESH